MGQAKKAQDKAALASKAAQEKDARDKAVREKSIGCQWTTSKLRWLINGFFDTSVNLNKAVYHWPNSENRKRKEVDAVETKKIEDTFRRTCYLTVRMCFGSDFLKLSFRF